MGAKKPAGSVSSGGPVTPDSDDSDTEETLTLGSSSRSTTPSVSTLSSLASLTSGHSAEEARSREQRREDRRRVIAQRELLRAGSVASGGRMGLCCVREVYCAYFLIKLCLVV